MRVIYTPSTPDRGDRQVWELDPNQVKASEAELIEDHWGGPWDDFIRNFRVRRVKAMRLMLWFLMRRDHPRNFANLRDVPDFYTGEIEVQSSSKELLEQRDQVEKSPALTDDERRMALAAFEVELQAAYEREGRNPDGTIDGVVVDVPAAAANSTVIEVPELPPTNEPSPTFGGSTG